MNHENLCILANNSGSINRRNFLKSCGVVGLSSVYNFGQQNVLSLNEDDCTFPEPCNSGSWIKNGVVLAGTETYESNWIQNFNSNIEILPDNRWRIWYGINTPDAKKYAEMGIAYADGEIGGVFKKTPAVFTEGEPTDAPLSIGNLPEGWRPVQPVHLHLKNGRQRLYFWAHGSGVVRFLAADSDDGRRYHVINALNPCLYAIWDRAVPHLKPGQITPWDLAVTHPSDQRRPSGEREAPLDLITNDCATVYQLPDGSFVLYAQTLVSVDPNSPKYVEHDNIRGFVRAICRFVSEDGLKWEQRAHIIEPDTYDSIDTQFYYFTVTHTDRGLVGLLGHYYVEKQYIDLEWCYSTDGINWRRRLIRKPWVKRGEPGTPDSYAIYPPKEIIYRDGKWWLFYTGVNYSHNLATSDGNPQSVIMAATTPSIWDK